jgi:hypothetical protein
LHTSSVVFDDDEEQAHTHRTEMKSDPREVRDIRP